MSLQTRTIPPIPELTAEIARVGFGKPILSALSEK